MRYTRPPSIGSPYAVSAFGGSTRARGQRRRAADAGEVAARFAVSESTVYM